MSNTAANLLLRKATTVGQLSRFSLPDFPRLPESFLKRFPELEAYERDKKIFIQNLTLALNRVLSTPQQ